MDRDGPFGDGLVVREEEPFWTGWAPQGGLIEVTARMDLSPRSTASVPHLLVDEVRALTHA